LPWKTELSWNFPLYEIYFLHSEYLSNLRLPWKNRVALKFFAPYIEEFWATCACPEKQIFPGIFHCIEIFFIIQDYWATCACPEKQSCPEIFHCIEYTFYIQEFWATCACPEKQSCLRNFSLYWIYYLHSGFLSNLRLPWKTELPWNFSLYWIHFLHSGVLSNLRLLWKTEGALNSLYWIYIFYFHEFWATCTCPEKQSLPWNFSSPVWRQPPPTPRIVRLCFEYKMVLNKIIN